jgi:hypothetical protein
MTSTRLDDPRALIPHRVTGYVLEKGELRRSEYVDISSRFAAGGTRSTVGDMIRFIEGIANGKVLKTATREIAWIAQPTRDRRLTSYGLGFGTYARNGRWVVAHSGSQQETRTNLSIVPSERFAIALASNFEDADLGVFEDKLFELFLGDPPPVNARANDDATNNAWRAMNDAYNSGLAYYDRHGKAMTTDARELAAAFRWLRDALKDAKVVADGRHPVAGEPLTKIGSYMASVLDAGGGLDVHHREGALRFFADYAASRRAHNFDRSFVARLRALQEEWPRVWTAELQTIDFSTPNALDVLERHRAALVAASLKPDFTRELIALVETTTTDGDLATATRAASLGVELYPRSPGLNGARGVLAVLSGDLARGRLYLANSLAIDPKGYASRENLVNIADFLATGPLKEGAAALRQVADELHR